MTENGQVALAAAVGIALGFISAQTLFVHSWLALIPWFLGGVAVGFLSADRIRGRAGAIYGIGLTATFLIAGFKGASDQVPGFLFILVILSIVGAAGGAIAAWCGARARLFVQ